MSRRAPVVSILTPAYNAARHFPATAASVLAQTYPDWEWIVVDDGSTDGTPDVVERVGGGRVRLVRGAHTGLPAAARNVAFAHARGEYIAYLDADDIWLPEKLALQVACFSAHPEAGLVFSRYYWYWSEPHERLRRKPEPDLSGLENPGWLFPRLALDNAICTSAAVVRRRVVEEHGLMDEDPAQRGTEDYEYWLRLAPHVRFAWVDAPLVHYRIHPQGISRQATRNARGQVLALEKALARLGEPPPELPERKTEARKRYWVGKGQVRDGELREGRAALVASLRLDAGNRAAWVWLAFSLLGRWGSRTFVRLLERVL